MTEEKTRPIWYDADRSVVRVIDQRWLPHRFVVADLKTVNDVIGAIREMFVRGAPLIGVTGAYGVHIAAMEAGRGKGADDRLLRECRRIKEARPTAVNLAWAVDRTLAAALAADSPDGRPGAALAAARAVAELEVDNCRRIGEHGVEVIASAARRKGKEPVNILTHCNAGWLACVAYGTATAPIYVAAERGLPVHVWVDETRPLNQGARLTAWELARAGIPHTVVADNTGGHLMQRKMVDVVIVGTDRTTGTGDVANKIGTYLKALAAKDNGIPFYVALPSSTFDWDLGAGSGIPIEERDPDEIRYVQGLAGGEVVRVLVPPEESPAANYAFDVTPARLVTGFITERGICKATPGEIQGLYPEKCGSNAGENP